MATPGQSILDKIAQLLASDVGGLGAAAAPKVFLVKSAFTPGPALLIANLTKAAFVGSGSKSPTAGVQLSFNDTVTGGRVVQLVEPAGGWHWEATTAVGLPETIYGYYIADSGDGVLYGSALLPAPVVISQIKDAVDIPFVRFTVIPGALV